jgi:NAD(P)H-flavin reductase
VKAVTLLTGGAIEIRLSVSSWTGHLAGQYFELRTSMIGSRWFSIANAPEGGLGDIEFVVASETMRSLEVGDEVEVLGPLGDGLAWQQLPGRHEPLLLIAGGMGIVPLMSIAREWLRHSVRAPLRLVYSVRTPELLLYPRELSEISAQEDCVVTVVYTRQSPGRNRPDRAPSRLSAVDLYRLAGPLTEQPECFVCGPASFVDDIAEMLVRRGHPLDSIHTESALALAS